MAGITFFFITLILGKLSDFVLISWQAFLPLVGAAILGIIIGNQIYYYSLKLIGVSRAYPISLTYPLITYIFEIIIFKEPFSWLKLIGIFLVIAGVISIAFSKVRKKKEKAVADSDTNADMPIVNNSEKEQVLNASLPSSGISPINEKESKSVVNETSIEKGQLENKTLFLGIGLALISASMWTTGTLLIKFGLTLTNADIITINGARMLTLIPISFVVFMSSNKTTKKNKFTWKSVLLVMLGAAIGTVVGNILYLNAIDLVGPSTASAINASGPLIATPLSILILKEKVNWRIILGTLCTIGGILIIILLG
jgi:drug/metabolite transporter (DMT)-like permease